MTRLSPWPVVAVGAIVWKDQLVLLIRRGKAPRLGHWSIPGGRQEAGETVQEATIRELREEAGIEIAISGLVEVVDLIEREGADIKQHYTVIDFNAEWRAGDLAAGDDALAAHWFALPDLAGLDLPPLQRKVIAKAAEMRRGATS